MGLTGLEHLTLLGVSPPDFVTTAAEAPLHEMNLVRQSIPPVLLAALADPYAYPSPLTCATIIDAVDQLDVALGPDFDNRAPKKKKSITGRQPAAVPWLCRHAVRGVEARRPGDQRAQRRQRPARLSQGSGRGAKLSGAGGAASHRPRRPAGLRRSQAAEISHLAGSAAGMSV